MAKPGIGRKACRGFTLIELMIAVVIVGILAAVAVPSYQDHVRKGRRAAAQAYLMDLAQKQQQYFVDSRAYAAAATALGYAATPSDVAPHYTVTIAVDGGPPPGFTLQAAPIGAQAGDQCGTLTLTSTGAKLSSAGSNCW